MMLFSENKILLLNPRFLLVGLLGVMAITIVQQLPAQEKISAQSKGAAIDGLGEEQENQVIPRIFKSDNLAAWCIVPFDSSRRGPAERAQMLVDLGIQRCAYDWREEHVPSFEQEIIEYRKHGIEFFAFWSFHEEAFRLFEEYDLHPQIWQMMADPGSEVGAPGDSETRQVGSDSQSRVLRAAQAMLPLAERTAALQLPLGLYNHGGWSGQPANMVAVCRQLHELGHEHVGIVYNFHHGHDDIAQWRTALDLMLPYLLCVNLNGMNAGAQPKILPIGEGQHEEEMLQALVDVGYNGPIGIIDHQEHLDSMQVLEANLQGLERVAQRLRQINPVEQADDSQSTSQLSSEFENDRFERLLSLATRRGNADRGAAVFGSDMVACVSCHAMQSPLTEEIIGGSVGPELSPVLLTREPLHIVRSIYLPQEEVDDKFQLWQALTVDGMIHSGYRGEQSGEFFELREIASGDLLQIPMEEIEVLTASGSPMPDGLVERLNHQQQLDLIAFLLQLRSQGGLTSGQFAALKASMSHGPTSFPIDKAPLTPERWPNHTAHVNRDRVFDFYTKQAEFFRLSPPAPLMLTAFPGLDGGELGHWGNQNEETWSDSRWSQTLLSSVQAGVVRHQGVSVPRGICVQLGESAEMFCCFDPDTLSYPFIWTGQFIRFSEIRYGLMDAMTIAGDIVGSQVPSWTAHQRKTRFRGFYRLGKRVVFAYEVDGQLLLDAPWVVNGQFMTEVAPFSQHSLREEIQIGGSLQWPEKFETRIAVGNQGPFAIDSIELPLENPWNTLFFLSGHDFLDDGSAMVCTIQGDVWHVDGLIDDSGGYSPTIRWKRFASGLHQPLGLLCAEDGIFVQCRDQLVRLIDLNGDGEADFYECFSNAFITSPAGHDYVCDLQRDEGGNFYCASGNQGLVWISSDGDLAGVVATGFRNPDGLGKLPDGTLTVPCSEGDWTPASMICAVAPLNESDVVSGSSGDIPHFGYGGPRRGQAPALPLVYLPRGLDNSSGGQAAVPKEHWGPLSEQLLHLSFGAGAWFSVLIDEIDGQKQGCVVPLVGDFKSGVHRGRFNPKDGHFYISGMKGWGTYTTDDGCFHRVRYTGQPFQHPIAFSVHRNGVLVEFAEEVEKEIASDTKNYFAQAWNYQYSGAYGSPEYSPSHPGTVGHDSYLIAGVAVLDNRRIFIEIPEMQPVSQLHLRMHVNRQQSYPSLNPAGFGHDLFLTVHRLREDFTEYLDYERLEKPESIHPIVADMALATSPHANPWLSPSIAPERTVEIKTGKNLSFETPEIRVRAGESIELSLVNPDVVPHNWVLVAQGNLYEIGKMVDQMTASAEAYRRHYVPDSPNVLAYTDMVMPGKSQTIYFRAPETSGRYPFLCTFPGHWMVMNGVMIVE